MTDDDRTIRIRDLNGELRINGRSLNGRVVAMGTLGHEDNEKIIRVYRGAAAFDDWPEGDDPYREHDFGKFDVDGESYIFKIDYYSLDEMHGSEHPAFEPLNILALELPAEHASRDSRRIRGTNPSGHSLWDNPTGEWLPRAASQAGYRAQRLEVCLRRNT